jgi:D-alanine-D-alanine ligase-like ATP-grasp enzyme/acylphosphatase
MPKANVSVSSVQLIAYTRPHAEPLHRGGDDDAPDGEVNYSLQVSIACDGREQTAAVEGLLGARSGKPMSPRYWDYLQAVASRMMGSELDVARLREGQWPELLESWLAPAEALREGSQPLDARAEAKVQRAVAVTRETLQSLARQFTRQLSGLAASPVAADPERAEALFHRADQVLFLPEAEPPTYTYQPGVKGLLQEASPPLSPNGSDDTERMLPLGTMDAKSHLMERECVRQGFDILRTGKGVFSAHRGEQSLYFKLSRSPLVSVDAISLCTHKEATREFLAPLGFPVPRGRMFPAGDHDNAMRFAKLIGYPVVVKPATGVRGIGVVPGITSDAELKRALHVLESSQLGHDDFIVEKHIFGEDYRIMVIGGKVRAATLRAPANVAGDGKHSVAELILIKNRYRQQIPHLKSRPIVFSKATQYQLDKQGLTLQSVPEAGQTVVLSGSCNLSQGGDSVNVLHEMHPSIIQVAEEAVKAVPGLDYCGIDFLIEDHRKPVGETDIGICELNAHAAIGTACYTMFGEPVNVPRMAIEQILHQQGLPLAPLPEESLTVQVRIRGKVTGVGYRKWLARHARRSGLTGYVKNASRRQVDAVLQGSLVGITALTTACIRGPSGALPTSVRVTHLDDAAPHDDFTLIR